MHGGITKINLPLEVNKNVGGKVGVGGGRNKGFAARILTSEFISIYLFTKSPLSLLTLLPLKEEKEHFLTFIYFSFHLCPSWNLFCWY